MAQWKPPELPVPANLTESRAEDLPPLPDREMARAVRMGRELTVIGEAMNARKRRGLPAVPGQERLKKGG